MFSRPKILFLVSLLFAALLNPKFNPYLLFKFIILVIIILLQLLIGKVYIDPMNITRMIKKLTIQKVSRDWIQ